jgi:hypothetical protein
VSEEDAALAESIKNLNSGKQKIDPVTKQVMSDVVLPAGITINPSNLQPSALNITKQRLKL